MNYTYVTVITTNDYVQGALALNASLRWSRARYGLVALLTENISGHAERILRTHHIDTIRVSDITPPDSAVESNKQRWNHTLAKLHVFSLSSFDKLVYLDCDMMVIRNIDALFERAHMSAVEAGVSAPGNEDWSGRFNSGIMVIVPEDGLCESLAQYISIAAAKRRTFSDQDVLNLYYDRWAELHDNHVDEGYNLFANYADYYINNLGYRLLGTNGKKVYVVHFTGGKKPWMMRFSQKVKHLCGLAVNNKKTEFLLFLLYILFISKAILVWPNFRSSRSVGGGTR